MTALSNRVVDLIDAAIGENTAAKVGVAFFRSLQPLGAKAIFARAYGGSRGGPAKEHILSRISPPGWEDLYSEFQDANYLVRELPKRSLPFRWSEISLISADERRLSGTLRDCGFPDGLATPCHGPLGSVGVVSLAFERLDQVAPVDEEAIKVASIVLQSRMRELAMPGVAVRSPLSPRERDCLCFVADGRSDAQIAAMLSISETTVLTHVQNAKRKLGVRTRSQAVAQALLRGLL